MASAILEAPVAVPLDTSPSPDEVWQFVRALHRYESNAYVTFAQYRQGTDGEFLKHLWSVQPRALERALPYVRDALLKDGAVSINGCCAPKDRSASELLISKSRARFSKPILLPIRPNGSSMHRSERMRRLNACYVDLDCHKLTPPIAPEEVVRRIDQMCEAGKLPPPTMHAFTGRGVWVLWFLHEKSSMKSHLGGQDDELARYAAVHRELIKRLQHLGADLGATDSARFLSLHGSTRSTTDKQVQWVLRENRQSYALKQLCQILDAKPERPKRARQHVNQQRKWGGGPEYTRRGWLQSAKNRTASFRFLTDVRGGFREGLRGNAAFVYAKCLENQGVKEDEALRQVVDFGRIHCTPPLPRFRCASAIRTAYLKSQTCASGKSPVSKIRRYLTYQTMADMLEVHPHEAVTIRQLLGYHFPAARRHGVDIAPPSKKGQISKRHVLERELAAELGAMTTSQWIATLAERGYIVSQGTVFSDLRTLGIPLPGRAAKPQMAALPFGYALTA